MNGHHPDCQLNCCRYRRLQTELSFYEREARLLRENVEAREALQTFSPSYRPPGLDERISVQDFKDALFILKLKARKLFIILRVLGRLVDQAQSYFELQALNTVDGARNWSREEREWRGKEALIEDLKSRFEDQTPRFTALQRKVWVQCYMVDFIPSSPAKAAMRKLNGFERATKAKSIVAPPARLKERHLIAAKESVQSLHNTPRLQSRRQLECPTWL